MFAMELGFGSSDARIGATIPHLVAATPCVTRFVVDV
jgi:hypothetical protein